MATTEIHLVNQWDNFHQNGPFPTKMILSTWPVETLPQISEGNG